MPQQVSIDDTNTTLIQYSGTWEALVGSTRQWEGTSHVSLDPGASATFSFRGYQVWVWGTIPAGTGSNQYDVAIDGGTPNVTSRASNGSANYNDVYYQSPLLRDTYHTIVFRNLGSNAKANTEVQFDRFMFETNDEIPQFTPPGGPITSGGSSAATSPSASTSGPSTMPSPPATPGGSSSTKRVGAITGAVMGVLVVVIIVLGYFLWRRKRVSKNTEVEKATGGRPESLTAVPFPLESASAGFSPSGSDPRSVETRAHARTDSQSQSPLLSEKARYIRQSAQGPAGAGPMPIVASPSSTTSSGALSPGSSSSIADRSLQHQPSLGMSDMSSMYSPHVLAQTQGGFQQSVTDVTTIPEADEALPAHPPPAYSNGAAHSDSHLIP